METGPENQRKGRLQEMAKRTCKMVKKASLGIFCEEVVDAAMMVEESILPLRRVL
jgi:hypothetical protein